MENERKAPDVPFIVFESEQARAERNIKRMQILCGVLAAVLVLTNAAWFLLTQIGRAHV